MKADQFKELPSADYMKLGFKHGFDAVADPSGAHVCENDIV